MPYSSHTIAPIFSDATIDELNIFVRENAPPSFQLVAQDKIYARVGLQEAFDLRFFISSKAPFKNEYFHAYSELILPAILTTLGRVKKVLVLDCDNTLWKGVVGEDGIEGIKVFREVQSLIVRQNKKGVLIAIVSKNNLEDVEKVFHSNSDMLLKPEHIVSWKVNWQDKATNIKELAGELNLGLSSFVFVDDSDFEVNLIRENLPEIHCIQVQKNYTDYVQTMMTLDSIFYKKVVSKEDLEKTAQYRTESLRKTSKVSFDNITDYLKSLNLKITFYEDQSSQISRIAQLTQKTNQFNLTTKRYTESEVQRMIESSDWKVFSFQVTDRYGDYGVTGALFAELNGREAFIDSFLLSCRILGRNLEKKIIETAMNRLKILGIERIGAEFVPTEKNSQTEDFYEEFQFVCSSKTAEKKEYFIHVENLPRQDLDYIEVINAR